MIPGFIRKKSSFGDLQNTDRFEREFVKPVKSTSQSLHTHDILYGGDQNKRKFLVQPHKCYILYSQVLNSVIYNKSLQSCYDLYKYISKLFINIVIFPYTKSAEMNLLNIILDNIGIKQHPSGILILNMNLQHLDIYFTWFWYMIQNSLFQILK